MLERREVMLSRPRLLKKAAPASPQSKSRVYYHGTPTEGAAQGILHSGIQPRNVVMPDEAKSRSFLAPRPDRVYLTDQIKYAAIYALGGSFFGTQAPSGYLDKKGAYGYIFEIPGENLEGDITVDEDSIGYFLDAVVAVVKAKDTLRKIEDGTWRDYRGLPGDLKHLKWLKESANRDLEGYQGKNPINQPENGRVANTLYNLARVTLTEKQWAKADSGEIAHQAQIGKKLQKVIPDWMVEWMIHNGGHVAHQGAIQPSRCWRFLKEDASKVSSAEVLSICEEIPMLRAKQASLKIADKPLSSSATWNLWEVISQLQKHKMMSQKKIERVVIQSPGSSYRYARDVLKPLGIHRFERGEAKISESSYFSYLYARDILDHKRFELGEAKIAKSSHYSFKYARDILEDRFDLGEPAIARDAEASYDYAKEVLKPLGIRGFKMGEPVIAEDDFLSYCYALDVLGGPFPEGEKLIAMGQYEYKYINGLAAIGKQPAHPELFDMPSQTKQAFAWPYTPLVYDPKDYKALKAKWGDQMIDELIAAGKPWNNPTVMAKELDQNFMGTYQSIEEAMIDLFSEQLNSGFIKKFRKPGTTEVDWTAVATKVMPPNYGLQGLFVVAIPGFGGDLHVFVRDSRPNHPLHPKRTAKDKTASKVLNDSAVWGALPFIRRHKMISKKKVEKVLLHSPGAVKALRSAHTSYWYVNNVLKPAGINRFERGEPAIAKNPELAYRYARDVLKPGGIPRFELAEPAIAKDPELAYRYATEVLQPAGIPRFELGEPTLAEDPKWAYKYTQHVLTPAGIKRFELAEPAIAEDARWAYYYALNVLKLAGIKRFELAEPTLAKSPEGALYYAKNVLEGVFELGEQSISRDSYRESYLDFLNSKGLQPAHPELFGLQKTSAQQSDTPPLDYLEPLVDLVADNLTRYRNMFAKPLGYREVEKDMVKTLGMSEDLATLVSPAVNQRVNKSLDNPSFKNLLKKTLTSPKAKQAVDHVLQQFAPTRDPKAEKDWDSPYCNNHGNERATRDEATIAAVKQPSRLQARLHKFMDKLSGVQQHKEPKHLPPRPDMRTHLDTEVRDEIAKDKRENKED